jgi:hypothetical protein
MAPTPDSARALNALTHCLELFATCKDNAQDLKRKLAACRATNPAQRFISINDDWDEDWTGSRFAHQDEDESTSDVFATQQGAMIEIDPSKPSLLGVEQIVELAQRRATWRYAPLVPATLGRPSLAEACRLASTH